MKVKIGDIVEVCDPGINDLWNHSFVGSVAGIFDVMLIVLDGDGNYWDVGFDQVKISYCF